MMSSPFELAHLLLLLLETSWTALLATLTPLFTSLTGSCCSLPHKLIPQEASFSYDPGFQPAIDHHVLFQENTTQDVCSSIPLSPGPSFWIAPSPSTTTIDGWILLTSSFFDFYVGSDCVYSKTCRLRLEK